MADVMDILFRAKMDVSDISTGVGQIQRDLKKLELPKDITDNLEKGFNKLTPLIKEYQKLLNKDSKTPKDIKNLEMLQSKVQDVIGDIKTDLNQINTTKIQPKVELSELNKLKKDITKVKNDISKTTESLFKNKGISTEQAQGILNSMGRATSLKNLVAEVQLKFNNQDIRGYTKAVDALENKIKSIKTESTKIDIAKALGAKSKDLKDLDNFFNTFFKNMHLNPDIINKVRELNAELKNLKQQESIKLSDSFKDGEAEIQRIINRFVELSSKSEQTGKDVSEAGHSIMTMTEQVKDLQQSTQYFFSLRNMINLLKRGIDEAVQSVKELDAAMTETAVVTDYKVSDLWDMLPQYTQLANQLGATTQGAYETMTLYFQQGLDQQQAFEIGAETMKMARIAGLDYAETTDMMTAALRGFNMELNETSAKHINDVYSELAAITASDTEELGTAMQRTASIAHSAGSSFEGTTAFLAQAIETTREPAENLGTAMKTIIARFQEMKKNPLEISEVDGEEVDFNKIDAALKTIGVDLIDANGQFRDFDKVMLDISARWDTLSQSQQRYIATVAAGSRQQSRFIAMVSNYDRTIQLMEAANNSAGASDEQFGKTMDSLEAKLNKLHNAWELFTMGIANNSMIKLAVDGLTGFLSVTNKLIDTLSLGSGAFKSFLSIFTAFTGLKVAGRVANSLIGGLGGLVDPQSTVKEGLKIGLFGQGRTNAQASAIYTPIVDSLSKISGQLSQIMHGKNVDGSTDFKVTTKQQYSDARKQLEQLSSKNGFSIGDTSALFSTLDAKHQRSLLNNNPGTKRAMKKASMSWFDSKGLTKDLTSEGKKYINAIYKGMEDGQISVDKGLKLIGRPDLWGEHFATESAQAISQHFAQKAEQVAQTGAWRQLGMKDASTDDKKIFLENAKNAEKYNKLVNENYAKALDGMAKSHSKAKGIVSDLGRFSNDIGTIGDRVTQAGYGISAFGDALSQLGGPLGVIGTGISAFGGAISTMGMSISGATGLINLFTEGLVAADGTLLVAGSTIAAVAAPLAALAAGFLLVRHHIKKVKEAGEEVTKTFNDTSKETQSNISKLQSYQGELASLSRGVDANGNNVSLDDSQYQRYLEIVNDIATINPAIVKGYNAQGHAIIDNNTALEETVRLQQRLQKEAYKTYLRTDSLQALINARNVNTDYGKAVNNLYSSKAQDASLVANRTSPLTNDVQSLADRLNISGDRKSTEYILEKYGIESLDALIRGEEQAVKKFVNYQDQIQADLSNFGVDLGNGVLEGFQTLGENTKAFDEAIKPVYDNLLALVSNSSTYKDLAPEVQSALTTGLKDIASKNLNAKEMQQAANYLMGEFQTAFEKAEPYLTQADEALETFTQDLDEAAYNGKAQDIAEELRALADQAKAVGQVEIAEWYENQASRIESAITNATYSIADGVDTLADNIAKAKTNFEALAEGIDDYYSLSDQAHGLIETALSDKNTGGYGSKTFWKTYQGLASEQAFNKHDKGTAIADMKQFQKYFTEGAEGVRAFYQTLRDNQEKSFKFTDNEGKETTRTVGQFFKMAKDGTVEITDEFKNLSDEQYSQLAAAFRLSDDGFTAVLNNLRQWADIDFSDPGIIRKALATDERSVTTNKKVEVEGQKDRVNRLYYGESTLKAETAELDNKDRKELVEDLQVQGSIQLPSGAEKLIKQSFDGGGEGSLLKQFVQDTRGSGNQMQNVMASLIKTNEYSKDDLEKIHGAIVERGLLPNAKDVDKSFEDIYSAAELEVTDPATAAANEQLSDISSTVSTIAGIVAAGKVSEGYLPDVAKQSDALRKEIIGGAGFDTWIQRFSRGQDANGNAITNKALYNEIYAKLDQYKTTNDNYINSLKQGRIAAEERGANAAELQNFDDEIAAAEENSKFISQYIQNAADSWERTQTDFYNAGQTVFQGLAEIRNNPNLSETQQKTETANVLTDFANKLQGLNFSPESIQSVFKENFGIELEVQGGEFASDVGKQINDAVNGQDYDINATLNIASIKLPGAAKGKNNTPSAIRRVGTMARGSKKRGYTINGQPTLTGELGPELVWEPRQNAAYMVGEHGPQFANLSKSAVVWNAEQTKKIKKNSKGVNHFGTGARGIHSFGTMGGGNATAGGNSKIPGMLDIDAMATIQDVEPPAQEPTIPVKAELQVEGGNKGNWLSKLFGGGKGGPSIDVAANVTSVNTGTQPQSISVVGNLTQLNTTASVKNIEATATVTQVIKSAQVAGEPISVKATATTTKVENKTPTQTKQPVGTQTMKVTADTSAAQAKIRQLINLFNKTYTLKYKASGPSSIHVPISPNFTGSWKKTVEINRSGANGINNRGFGSLAKGSRYGTIGPKGQGGLTLTGEKGFEIAWLPSENRSMILGANGPQMLDLPKDAVVFTNEQSKKILKQKSILAGSHSSPNSVQGTIDPAIFGGSNASKRTYNKSKDKSNKAVQKAAKTVETVSAKAGKVFVWWENMARSVEKAQRDAEQNQKTLERLLKNFGTTLSEYNKTGETYRKSLETQIDLANQRIKQANDELHITDYGADSKKSNDYLAAIGARQEISYEVTKTKKSKKGKKTTTTETKKETLNLAKYIKLINGIYQLNQAEIDKVAKSNKSKAEAIKAAAEKQLNDLYSKLKSAEDDRIKAEEALEQFYNDAYEAFGRWDKSITAVYLLGQQLEKLSAEANIYESAVDLQTSKLEAGFAKAIDVLPQITSALERNRDIMIAQVQTNAAKVDAAWKEYSDSLSLRAVTEKYLANQNSTDAAYDYDVMKNTLAFLQNAGLNQSNFNLETAAKALEELYANQWKGDDYEKIKEGLDKIAEKQGDYYSTLADTYSSLNEVYQKIEEYQSYMADFEGTLIKGIEDQANKQIDKLNKLNSSLSTAAKDLIDEVKRKLDERRKQEDNAKTENEISQKQQRLAALRADTAGGHAAEITQLEKEIADSQQSYGRTLEDQLLDRLSQQQDNAEKQRERQIALLEAQRDFAAATGSNVDQINKWLQDPANYAEEIKSAFLANNNFEELGELERKQLLEEFESKFGTYLAYANVLPKLEEAASQDWPESISKDVPNSLGGIEDKLNSIIGLLNGSERQQLSEDFESDFNNQMQMIAEINSDAITLKELKERGADATTARALSADQGIKYTAKDFLDAEYTPQETKGADFTAKDFKQDNISYDIAKQAGFKQQELIDAEYEEAKTDSAFAVKTETPKDKYLKYLQDLSKSGTMNKSTFSTAASLANKAGLSARTYMQNLADIDKPKNITWAQVIKAAKDSEFNKYRMALSFTSKAFQTGYDTVYGKGAYQKNRAYAVKNKYKMYGYASGGLASQTGPAWLDGTPSKPELILNAQDTKNFIALKDVLAHAVGSTSNINNSYGGDATYEININVDHLNNDYDVDKVVERVKKKIVQDSGYRNVTQVRKFR